MLAITWPFLLAVVQVPTDQHPTHPFAVFPPSLLTVTAGFLIWIFLNKNIVPLGIKYVAAVVLVVFGSTIVRVLQLITVPPLLFLASLPLPRSPYGGIPKLDSPDNKITSYHFKYICCGAYWLLFGSTTVHILQLVTLPPLLFLAPLPLPRSPLQLHFQIRLFKQ